VLAQADIGPGPSNFTLSAGGNAGTGYTLNSNSTLSNIPVSSSVQAKQVTYSTVPKTADTVNLYAPSGGLWATDLDKNQVDIFTSAAGVQALELSVPVAVTPVMVVGPTSGGQRNYVISQGFDAPSGSNPNGVACNVSPRTAPVNGEADAIETPLLTVSAYIPLGKCPVYAVQSPDNRRVFVLNRGDDTISVINSQNNTLDSCVCPPTGCVNQDNQTYTCHPSLPVSPAPGSAHAGPIYAEYSAVHNQLVVANYDGNSISVIDVSLDQFGNDSPTFGTTYTIPVGVNPASVTVLADGSRAYTANQGDGAENGTVSIVDLSSYTIEKPALAVVGHPRTVVSTQNSQFGKVYVASPDSPYLTIIQTGGTDPDTVDTTILVQGNIVDARVSTQNGTPGNNNNTSRSPGHGQPCNLPNVTGGYSVGGTTVEPTSSLANCAVQDPSQLTVP
jgi:DNA-binding beta-propeller fold protein YncE